MAAELLGFGEFVACRPSESRAMAFGIAAVNLTSAGITGRVNCQGSIQRMDVSPPRMTAAVR